jgi:hypothetical protein
MNPNFQVYAKILKFALIYRNEGYMAVKFGVILTRLPHGLKMETFQ